MGAVCFYGCIAAIVILYINFDSTLKKVKNEEDTQANTVIGVFCSIALFICICGILDR
jgi:cell division protein FtsX